MLLEIDDWVSFHVGSNIEEVHEELGLDMKLLEDVANGEADISLPQLDAIKKYVQDPETLLRGLKRKTKELQESDPTMFRGTTIPEDTPTLKKGATEQEVMNFICSMMDQLEEFKRSL